MATILDVGRLPSALRLAQVWPGPISAAVLAKYGVDLTKQHTDLRAAISSPSIDMSATSLRFTLVENTGFAPPAVCATLACTPLATVHTCPNGRYDCPARFPFNMLRNVALSRCIEDHVLIVDVDFVPMPLPRASASLRQLAAAKGPGLVALVLPAFEALPTGPHNSTLSLKKQQLREAVRRGNIVPFGSKGGTREEWLPAHSCTQSLRWLETTSSYLIRHCHPQYEPYVLLPRNVVPRFDESFSGRGFDKISFIYELFARGFHFWASPDSFVVHLPGPHQLDAISCSETTSPAEAAAASTDKQIEDEIAQRRNPGETCVRSFLNRMRNTYRYQPSSSVHTAFRKDVSEQGWKCNAVQEAAPPSPRMFFLYRFAGSASGGRGRGGSALPERRLRQSHRIATAK